MGAGRPVHGVKEANAKSESVGDGRPVQGVPVHGVKEANAKNESVGDGRPVHGVKEANAKSGQVGAGRPSVHGVPVHGVKGRSILLPTHDGEQGARRIVIHLC